MTNAAIVQGEYITFKHVKTRKVVILEVEVPEELFQDVITKLGMPIGGESKPVAVALLNKSAQPIDNYKVEKTEGEKLMTRAVMLCKDNDFAEFCNSQYMYPHDFDNIVAEGREKLAIDYIYHQCQIESRSELITNEDAQVRFLGLLRQFDAWKVSKRYADNLSR